ncbi:hypothetical protein ATCC90586_005009 [Pythium insidiosum]|nr:hypothetical protein ATCC90586_005009 [Pythium insidiosum]
MTESEAEDAAGSSARAVQEVLLLANDVSVVDRSGLSLWHFQQLTKPLFSSPTAAPPAAEPDESDSAGEGAAGAGSLNGAVAKTDVDATAMELDDGMAIAAITFQSDPTDPPDAADPRPEAERPCRLSLASRVRLVYKRYRCVLYLDASPSTLSIDPTTGKVFLDTLYESAELFINGLLRPMEVGGDPFVPELHVSVIVQGALVSTMSVLVQGFVLQPSNAASLLKVVRERLALIEKDWAAKANQIECMHATTQRASLSSMIQNAVFALNSLPTDAAPLLVMATDGVVDLFDAYSYDNLVMQLVRHDVQCHFLCIGTSLSCPFTSFGFVPDLDLLRFVAASTGGAAIDYTTLHAACMTDASCDTLKRMTAFQQQLLVRSSSIRAISAPIVHVDGRWGGASSDHRFSTLKPYRVWRQKVHEYRIQADISRIVEARIREGFRVNKVYVKTYCRAEDDSLLKMTVTSYIPAVSGDCVSSKILIVFVLEWKQNVWIEMKLFAIYSADQVRRRSHQACFHFVKQFPREVAVQ